MINYLVLCQRRIVNPSPNPWMFQGKDPKPGTIESWNVQMLADNVQESPSFFYWEDNFMYRPPVFYHSTNHMASSIAKKTLGAEVIHDSGTQTIHLFPKLVRNLLVESRINSKFFRDCKFYKIYRRMFVCCEKTNEDIFAKQVCKRFTWVTNLWKVHAEVLPNRFLPRPLLS